MPCIRPLAVLAFQPLEAAPSTSSNKDNMLFQQGWLKRADCPQVTHQQGAAAAHSGVARFPQPFWTSPVRTENLPRQKGEGEVEKEEQGLGKGEARVGRVEEINKAVDRVWRAGTMYTDS